MPPQSTSHSVTCYPTQVNTPLLNRLSHIGNITLHMHALPADTSPHWQSWRKDPHTPRSGASCCVGEPFWAHKNAKNLLVAVAGAPPRTPLGELTTLPQAPSWWGGDPTEGALLPLPKNPTYNIVIVLVLCVCTHVYENALLFSLQC